jgi:hypothetical protein
MYSIIHYIEYMRRLIFQHYFPLRHGASGKGNALRNWELRAREVRYCAVQHSTLQRSTVLNSIMKNKVA